MNKTFFNRPVFIYGVSVVLVVIALAPVLCFSYFPTVDGPAHLYNARIIRELWWGNSELYSHFFKFNEEPVPNWTGHFMMVVTGLFLPAWMVEKVMVLMICLGIPLGIVRLTHSFGTVVSWRHLLLLPFLYTLTLYLGFFNFMLSLVIMLLTISWMVSWNQHKTQRNFIKVLFFTTLLYFSHILAFGIALLFVGLLILWERFKDKNALLLSVSTIQKMSCFVPGIFFAIWFFSSRNVEGFRKKTEQLPPDILLKWIHEGAPLVGMNGAEEVPYTSVFMIGIALLMIGTIVIRIRTKITITKSDLLLLFSMLMMICYFVVPDGMASGGFISIRLLLLALIFAVAWLLTFKLPVWISVLAVLMSIYVSFSTLPYRMQVAKDLNKDAENMVKMSSVMSSGSVVLPLNYSENWLHLNLTAYLGVSGNMMLLENYEADYEEFPLQWKQGFQPVQLTEKFKESPIPIVSIQRYESGTGIKINFIARWDFDKMTNDSTAQAVDKNLRTRFSNVRKVGAGDYLFEK